MSENTIPLDAIGQITEITNPTSVLGHVTVTVDYESPVLKGVPKQHTFEINSQCPVTKANTELPLPAPQIGYQGESYNVIISESQRSTSLRPLYLAVCNKCPFFTKDISLTGCQGFRTPKIK